MQKDADAYGAVTAAYKLPKEPAEALEARTRAIAEALLGAALTPLETARQAAAVARLAATVGEKGNQNAVSDAGVAALLADAAVKGAAYNVRINLSALKGEPGVSADAITRGEALVAEAQRIVSETAAVVKRVTDAVERAIG